FPTLLLPWSAPSRAPRGGGNPAWFEADPACLWTGSGPRASSDEVGLPMPMNASTPIGPAIPGHRAARAERISWWLCWALLPVLVAAAPDPTGERIYQQKCASCHGASGEGTDDHYPKPLVGERSVEGLARVIAKTMPEDDPGTCVGAEAEKVAAYIYETFYSKAAQARHPF